MFGPSKLSEINLSIAPKNITDNLTNDSIESLSKLLASEDFRTRANPNLVQAKEDALRNSRQELQSIVDKIASL